MADSVETIEQQVDDQFALQQPLSLMQSISNVAVFKGLRAAFAWVMNQFERQQDDYEARIQQKVDEKQFGTDPWWQQNMLAYQHGDILQFIDKRYQYAAVDATKQVINLCSVTPVNGSIKLKCASLVNGKPQLLTNDQLLGAQSYANETRPSGTYPSVQSYPADMLRMYLKVFYNAQGDLPTITAAVIAAINTFLTLTQNGGGLDFDGVLYVNRLIDAIQAVPGVIKDQVVVQQIVAKPSDSPEVTITSSYQAEAGYFVIDDNFPLTATLTFVAV